MNMAVYVAALKRLSVGYAARNFGGCLLCLWSAATAMLLFAACGGDGDGGEALCPGSCLNLAGTHTLTGDCNATECTITQSGCDIQVSCNDGTTGSGKAGDGLKFSGAQASCSGDLTGGAVVGSCRTPDNQTCSFRVEALGNILCKDNSKPGSQRANGDADVPCRQKDDADTDSDCVGMAGKPRKLDCEDDQTALAEAMGCVRTDATDSDVCCPLSIQGVTEGGDRTGSDTQIRCTLAEDATTDSDCVAMTGYPLKFDCETEGEQLMAIQSAGCTPEDPGEGGDFDVCCPNGVTGSGW